MVLKTQPLAPNFVQVERSLYIGTCPTTNAEEIEAKFAAVVETIAATGND